MIRQECECGKCGKLAKPGNRFILGHSGGVDHHTKESKLKIGSSVRETMKDPKRRKAISIRASKQKHNHENKLKISKTESTLINGMYFYEEHFHYLTQYEFRLLANKIFKRDKRKCVLCGNTKKNHRINIHHIVPLRVGYKNRLCDHESNMVVLCMSCHNVVEPRKIQSRWINHVIPFVKYLKKFRYKEMLVSNYL
jgi:hypothetical protein